MYTCGPTVYGSPHIGNLRAYIFSDTLRRTLEFLGYEVNQVVNITDVGHLTSDSDAGEDKIEKGARAANKTVWEVARGYEDEFRAALKTLNIKLPTQLPRATEHMPEQVAMIEKLDKKGFVYQTSDGIYFDTAKFPEYGKLGGQKLDEKAAGARVGVNDEKRHPADFALWKFCAGDNADHIMRWANPLGIDGEGFPGWHIECSAMSAKYLGKHFDIHTGGIDHIPVHHENEIAQSEAAHGQFVNYWLHNEFLTIEGGKMSKSLDNLFTLADIAAKGIDPLAFRLLCLGTHYRQKLNFSWEALEGAQNSLNKLRSAYQQAKAAEEKLATLGMKPEIDQGTIKKAQEAIEDDLNTPKVIAALHETGKLAPQFFRKTLQEIDKILGLQLDKPVEEEVIELTPEQEQLLKERETARAEKNWVRADEIRDAFAAAGLEIEDGAGGQTVKRR